MSFHVHLCCIYYCRIWVAYTCNLSNVMETGFSTFSDKCKPDSFFDKTSLTILLAFTATRNILEKNSVLKEQLKTIGCTYFMFVLETYDFPHSSSERMFQPKEATYYTVIGFSNYLHPKRHNGQILNYLQAPRLMMKP